MKVDMTCLEKDLANLLVRGDRKSWTHIIVGQLVSARVRMTATSPNPSGSGYVWKSVNEGDAFLILGVNIDSTFNPDEPKHHMLTLLRLEDSTLLIFWTKLMQRPSLQYIAGPIRVEKH